MSILSHRGHGGHRGKKTLDNQERKAADELFGICKDHVDRQIPSFSQKKVIK